MNSHPSKVVFQFHSNEVYNADFLRFHTLFSNFDRLPSHRRGVLKEFYGAVSITFDPSLLQESSSPFEHPAFPRFAQLLMENTTILPFICCLNEEVLMMLALGSLDKVAYLRMSKSNENRVVFNPNKLGSKIDLLKDQARMWAEKAGMNSQEISDVRVALQTYLSRQNLNSFQNWGMA